MPTKGTIRVKENNKIVEYYPQTTYDVVIDEAGGNLKTDMASMKAFKESAGNKLNGIANNATKTEKSTTNGNVKINGTETTVYTHPSSTGNKHVPSGGASGQILRWSADGTAVWGADNNTTYVPATTTAHGLMSKEDKVKMDGIATGANKYVHPSAHDATMITESAAKRFVTDSEKSTWNAKASTAVVTTTANGLMYKEDKVKLNGIATGANNYVHPSDVNTRHVTDAEKATWNAKETPSGAQTKATKSLTDAKAYADTKVAGIVNTAPEALDTLKELATALGNDPNFSTTVMTEIGKKVDKVTGKGLSTNDYTTAEKTKLSGIATGANNYVHPTGAGNNHVPSGGASGQILRWSAAGVAVWGADNNTTYGPVTTTANGLMLATDKVKLDGIATGANKTILNNTVSSTSTTEAATANAVKTAYDKANHSHPYAGTSHGNHVPTTQTANNAVFLRNDNSWQTINPDSIGASRGARASASTAAVAGWYRIAQTAMSISNAIADFQIRAAVSGKHSSTKLTVGITYGQSPVIQQIAHTAYSVAGITKARIVYHTTYDGKYAYLEVYNPDATARTIEVLMFGNLGWSLVAPSTAGSIPSGYTNKEITLATGKIVADINGTVNGYTISKSVPSNAVFTDTKYTHPNDANTRHVTDSEKSTWNAKASTMVVTTTTNGLMSKEDKVKLNGIATGANNYVHPTGAGNTHIPTGGASGQILRWSASGVAVWGADNNTTYGVVSKTANGLAPQLPNETGTTKYLRQDGTWAVPPNTIYTHPTGNGNNHIPANGAANQFLKYSASGTAIWSALTAASTNAAGIVQLNDATNSTSTTNAATANAVKKVMDAVAGKASTAAVTTTANGLMIAADKVKLNGIATGANNYTHPTGAGNNHIPSGGASGQILGCSSSGVASWTSYQAKQGITEGCGYSFIGDGSLDTGMFSTADGDLQLRSNGVTPIAMVRDRVAVYTPVYISSPNALHTRHINGAQGDNNDLFLNYSYTNANVHLMTAQTGLINLGDWIKTHYHTSLANNSRIRYTAATDHPGLQGGGWTSAALVIDQYGSGGNTALPRITFHSNGAGVAKQIAGDHKRGGISVLAENGDGLCTFNAQSISLDSSGGNVKRTTISTSAANGGSDGDIWYQY